MYFVDEKHQKNFDALANFYGKKQTDIHYRSSIYIASVPDIYHLLDLKTAEFGPLISLSTYDEEKKMRVPSAAGLTGSTSQLVRIGLSLFRGDPVSLDFQFGEEFNRVVIQAMKVRLKLDY